jgi:hypothetical protein
MSRLRAPALSHGVTSFLWAFGLALYIMLGALAIGIDRGTSFVVAVVSGFAIFLFVRVYGEDEPRHP